MGSRREIFGNYGTKTHIGSQISPSSGWSQGFKALVKFHQILEVQSIL